MTSQRWTRIRPPISPLPHHLPPLFLPRSPTDRVSGGSPSPAKGVTPNPITSHPPSNTYTHNALSFMPTIFHLLHSISILSSLAWFVSLAQSPSSLIQKRPTPSFHLPVCRYSALPLITPGNSQFFATTAGEGENLYVQHRAQMKCPFSVKVSSWIFFFLQEL